MRKTRGDGFRFVRHVQRDAIAWSQTLSEQAS
jgi:hypothetical protein